MSVAEAPARAQVDRAWEGVFPLPLTPIEATFILADRWPGYPMLADISLEFDGVLDRQVFTAALSAALARNPLFCCRVQDDPKLGQVWVRTPQMPELDWAEMGTPLGERYDARIDLRKEIGLRIWVREEADQTTVLLHFHHACSDALGSFAFIEDLLALYSTLYPSGPAVALRPLRRARLLQRGNASIPKRKWWQRAIDLICDLREALVFLLQAPAELAGPKSPADDAPNQMISRSLGPELTTQVRAAATQAGATVNDVLLCSLFVTLRNWNQQYGGRKGRKWLRIIVPQNLRAPEDAATPAANIMSFAFLTRRRDLCASAAELMPTLHAETQAIRRSRLSVFFLTSVAAALAIGVSEKLLASKRCFATASLANLGTPTRRFVAQFLRNDEGLIVGNTIFRSLSGVPPVRPGTRAAFAIVSSVDDLTLTLKRDPQYFGREDAQRLLDEFVGQIAATAAKGRGGQPESTEAIVSGANACP